MGNSGAFERFNLNHSNTQNKEPFLAYNEQNENSMLVTSQILSIGKVVNYFVGYFVVGLKRPLYF